MPKGPGAHGVARCHERVARCAQEAPCAQDGAARLHFWKSTALADSDILWGEETILAVRVAVLAVMSGLVLSWCCRGVV